jgi:hypothetical protein
MTKKREIAFGFFLLAGHSPQAVSAPASFVSPRLRGNDEKERFLRYKERSE